MRTRWLAPCGVLLVAAGAAAAQPPPLTVGVAVASSPDRPVELPPLLPVPATPQAVPPGPPGPRTAYDPGYQYLPEQAPPGGKLPPCPCRPIGRWWMTPSLELGWAPTSTAPGPLRLLIPDGRGGSVPGPVLPVGGTAGTQFRVGMGLNAGVWLDRCQYNGLDAGFYFLGTENRTVTGAAPGAVVVFPDGTARGEPLLFRLPAPLAANFSGTFSVTTANWYATADVNYRHTLLCEDAYRLDVLAGYRYGYVIDEVYLGDPRENEDKDHRLNRLAAANQFHGAQIGLSGEYRFADGWYVTATKKLAFGAVFSDVTNGGLFTTPQVGTPAGFATAPLPAGSSSRFAVMPVLNVAVGRQIGDHGRVFAGYTLQYLDRVVRLDDALDSAGLRTTDFWVQSVSLGMELRY
jgi:hypothetical protein